MSGIGVKSGVKTKLGEKIFTVVNPAADNGRTGKNWPGCERYFRNRGLKMEIFLTEDAGQAAPAVRKALRVGYQMIMAVGGDGTVNEVVNGFFEKKQLINSQAGLLIFSRGTGSDYIRSLGISKAREEIVEIADRKRKKFVDLGYITYIGQDRKKEEKYFVNLVDCGIGGETVSRIQNIPRIGGGLFTYLLGGLWTLIGYKNKIMKVMIDGEEVINDKINSVIIGNGEYFAGGMKIVPGADLYDGILDILILKDLSKPEIIFNLYRAIQGRHLTLPGVEMFRGRMVTVKSEDEVLIDVDGEAAGKLPIKVGIEEKKLPVYF